MGLYTGPTSCAAAEAQYTSPLLPGVISLDLDARACAEAMAQMLLAASWLAVAGSTALAVTIAIPRHAAIRISVMTGKMKQYAYEFSANTRYATRKVARMCPSRTAPVFASGPNCQKPIA